MVYHNNLLKLQNTHPQVYEDFRNGYFVLKRTSKQFSCEPVDLTLKQIISTDAACQRTGISALTNSISAIQGCTQSHSVRVTLISKMFEEMGLTRKKGVTEELKFHRMNQNWQHLEKLINGIAETMNTFSDLIDKNYLSNITTSKAAHEETATFLLYIMEIGRKGRDQFIDDCVKDSSRFSQPIKRQKIKNCVTQAGKFNVSSASNNKTRVLFRSIFFHTLQAKMDIGEVLRYPLTSALLSLCYPDGLCKAHQNPSY